MNKSLFIPMTRGLEVRNTTTMDTVTMLATGLWLGSGTHSCGAASGMPLMEAEASIWNKITYIYIYIRKGGRGEGGEGGWSCHDFWPKTATSRKIPNRHFRQTFLVLNLSVFFKKIGSRVETPMYQNHDS